MKVDLRQLEALSAVVDARGFERAAQKLGITQSAVSQRIRALETRLGKVLLRRTSPPEPTEAGRAALRYFRQMDVLQAQLAAHFDLAGQDVRSLPIGVNADSLATWLFDALDPVLRDSRYRLDFRVADQDVTHELLRNGDVIGCIKASPEPVSGCNAFPLGVMVYRALASAGFHHRWFCGGVTEAALQAAPCVEFSAQDALQNTWLKQYLNMEPLRVAHRVPAVDSFLECIRRGYAWGCAPDVQTRTLLARGDLVELIPDTPVRVPLYWHIWDLRTPLNQKLTDALLGYAPRLLQEASV
ncbi:LysR family transcriptional regulator ArgP [Hahella sp. SMD15-11]|uniref:LysR family transcriptional regulator ArgP n=1 Tax=Thermohahella caldifontis TaxID=3142973 RepID=A0AB39UW88_9GAMM